MIDNPDNIVVGIDIGTTKVCTLIGFTDLSRQLRILGKGLVPFKGVKKGIIVDIDETSKAIRLSKEKAEKESNVTFNSAYVNIYGTHVNVLYHEESVNISGSNQIITEDDLNNLYDAIEKIPIPGGNQVIDIVPRQYIVDGYEGILDPIGMTGLKLKLEADVVVGKLTSVNNIVRSMENAGVGIDGLIIEAYATGEMSLSPEEKELGIILIDVGGGITDVSAFKKGKMVMYDSIPVGGDHITNDISIGLNISFLEAEKIKRQYELALTSLIENDQEISIYDTKLEKSRNVYISHIIEIIEARVFETLSLAKNLVSKYENIEGFSGGVVLTGGGISYVDGNIQIGEDVFNLPVRVSSYKTAMGIPKPEARPEIAVAAGIVKHVSQRLRLNGSSVKSKETPVGEKDKVPNIFNRLLKSINKWFFYS